MICDLSLVVVVRIRSTDVGPETSCALRLSESEVMSRCVMTHPILCPITSDCHNSNSTQLYAVV